MNKKKFLSIGMLSKATNVHIKSIRYYDELGILTPAYVDNKTNYRYYSFNQIPYVLAIQFCVELEIPLRNFSLYLSDNKKVLLNKLMETGTVIAEKKIEAINEKLNLLKAIQYDVQRAEQCLMSENAIEYSFPEKICWIAPFDGEIGSESYKEEVIKAIFKINKEGLQLGYELGIIFIFSGDTVNKYIFIDIETNDFQCINNGNLLFINESKYLCQKKDENIEITSSTNIFHPDFDKIILEVDFFTEAYNFEDSIYEIRYKLQE